MKHPKMRAQSQMSLHVSTLQRKEVLVLQTQNLLKKVKASTIRLKLRTLEV